MKSARYFCQLASVIVVPVRGSFGLRRVMPPLRYVRRSMKTSSMNRPL